MLMFLSDTKQTTGEAVHSPPSAAEYQNELSYTSTSAYDFVTCIARALPLGFVVRYEV
jgi:hypothetical protein